MSDEIKNLEIKPEALIGKKINQIYLNNRGSGVLTNGKYDGVDTMDFLTGYACAVIPMELTLQEIKQFMVEKYQMGVTFHYESSRETCFNPDVIRVKWRKLTIEDVCQELLTNTF